MASIRSLVAGILACLGLLAVPAIANSASDPWQHPLPIFLDSVRMATDWVDASQAQTLQRHPEQAAGLRWIPLASGESESPEQAQVALVQTADGLMVLGRVRQNPGAVTGEWFLQWSTLSTLPLPQVGWQRIQHPLASDAQCDRLGLAPGDLVECPRWRAAQRLHRERLRAAFRPGWRLAGEHGEADPRPAWSAPAAAFAAIEPAPPGPPTVAEAAGERRFALALPWSSWPLAADGVLRRLYLQARYCRAPGSCVQAPAAYGAALELELARPLSLHADACGQSPTGSTDAPWYLRIGDSLPSAVPAAATSAFSFTNPGGGYLDRPDPDRTSPELVEFRFRARELADNTRLCLPEMRLWRPPQASVPARALSGDQLREIAAGDWPEPSAWPGGRHPYWQTHTPDYVDAGGGVDIDTPFEERTLADGRHLLIEAFRLDPPRSGEGMHGACDRASFAVWILRPGADSLRLATRIEGYGPDLCAGSGLERVTLSDDSRRVASTRISEDTAELDPAQQARFEAGDTIRIHEHSCLDEASDSYLPCGRRVDAQPSEPSPEAG